MKEDTEKEEIVSCVKNAELDSALDKLATIATKVDDSEIIVTIDLLKSRLSDLNRNKGRGIISTEDARLERNRISDEILKVLSNLEERKKPKTNISSSLEKLKLPESEIFEITKAAILTIELEKIKEKFYKKDWKASDKILRKLLKFSDHTSIRLANEVFSFLTSVSGMTRGGCSFGSASTLQSLVIQFFPYKETLGNDEEFENIAFQCISIGDSLFYDAAIYLKDLGVGVHGLSILKWIYWRGKERKLESVKLKVLETYQELEVTLQRPERNDLGTAKRLLQVFKDDLEHRGMTYPVMPVELFNLVFVPTSNSKNM